VDNKIENIAKINNYSNPHDSVWIPSPKISLKSVTTQIPHESGWTASPKLSLKSVTTQILMNLGGYQARKYR